MTIEKSKRVRTELSAHAFFRQLKCHSVIGYGIYLPEAVREYNAKRHFGLSAEIIELCNSGKAVIFYIRDRDARLAVLQDPCISAALCGNIAVQCAVNINIIRLIAA